jgi:HK97 family phage major capsid protein
MGTSAGASDVMINRLEKELGEKQTLVNGIFERANAANRDLDEQEGQIVDECRGRMEAIKTQLEKIGDVNRMAFESRSTAQTLDQAISQWKGNPQEGAVEYRSGGEYILDIWRSHNGNREATERLDTYYRAAAHQKTSDNLGLIPDPVVGDVINFIDAARPLVSALGPMPLTSATFHRPRVTQHTAVAVQGTAGGKTDEKTELTSQKMVIDRLTAEAVTYGGYVNVSRQNIDFSTPQALDLIVNDLAAQYAIETEAATADLVTSTATTAITYDLTPAAGTIQDAVATAVWSAAAVAYTAVKGQGRLFLVVAPDVLGTFGPLFQPVNPQNQQGGGFNAANFGQGQMGNIAGVSLVMSAGLGSGDAFMVSSSALEVYEQRVGTLQAVEPSVAGVQVAYMGYFTPLLITDDAIVPLNAA